MKKFFTKIAILSLLAAASSLISACIPQSYNEEDLVIDWQSGGSFQRYSSHTILRVSDRPLFKANGTVDRRVLFNLMALLNDEGLDPLLRPDKQAWPTGLSYTGLNFHAVTAEDFSRFVVPDPTDRDHSGAIIIKLFETLPPSRSSNIAALSSQWWQLVYRAADDDADVLTLWMFEPYRLSVFNGDRYDSLDPSRIDERYTRIRTTTRNTYRTAIPINTHNTIKDDYGSTSGAWGEYTMEGNYSASIARSNLLRDAAALFNAFTISRFISAPADVPGAWQSSHFQTGSNFFGRFYVSGEFQESDTSRGRVTGSANMEEGLGAASRIWGNWDMFFHGNGMDGLSVGPDKGQWRHSTITSAYQDLLWLPSDFEIRTMGHNKDNARFQTFIEDPDDYTSALITNRIPEDRTDFARGRSGLWRLNGYDRGYTLSTIGSERAWLRSADSASIGNINTVTPSGNRYAHGVINRAAMRPGIHVNIRTLAAEFAMHDAKQEIP